MKTSVTLNNGTVLEVGKKYTNGKYPFNQWQKVVSIVEDRVWMIDENGEDDVESINHNWLPYTAPQEDVRWKTFLMVVQHHKTHVPYQVIIRCKSIEEAKIIHKNAIEIKEVEIDIREK
jgi:hypothetical protein